MLELQVAAFLVLGCFYYLLFRWRRRNLLKLSEAFPGPPTIPILGNAHMFLGNTEDIMNLILKCTSEYDNAFRVWLGPMLIVGVGNPEDLQIVLNNSKCLEKDYLYSFFKNTVGEGLFSAPVEKWRKHRRVINPAFNTRFMEQFVPVFRDKNDKLVMQLKKHADAGEAVDMWHYIAPTMLEIICKTAMGYDLDKSDSASVEFSEALVSASEFDSMRIYKLWLHPKFIFDVYSYFSGLNQVYKNLKKLPTRLIEEKKEEFRKRKCTDEIIENGGKAFLDILLELNENGANFSDDDIRDEVITMMIGGSETTALTNCFALLMLAMHPEIQEKAFKEISGVFEKGNRPFTKEDAEKLQYLEQCVKETLRLFPVGPLFLRKTMHDVKITDYVIPAGATVLIPPIKTHRDAKIYPNPMTFNPDNFLPERINARHRYSFIGFSGGPRGCIGSKYAILSMKVTLSSILRNYSLTTDVLMSDIKLKVDLLMRSVGGYPIKLHSRK